MTGDEGEEAHDPDGRAPDEEGPDATGDPEPDAAAEAEGDAPTEDDAAGDEEEQEQAAGDPNADQDAPVTAVGWISGFAIAALALADGNPVQVVVLGAVVGVVGLATWVAIRRDREREAFQGQVAVVLLSVVGAGAALLVEAYLLAAAFGLVAVMLGGRVFEKWRA